MGLWNREDGGPRRDVLLGWDDGRLFVVDDDPEDRDANTNSGLDPACVPVTLLDELEQAQARLAELEGLVWGYRSDV